MKRCVIDLSDWFASQSARIKRRSLKGVTRECHALNLDTHGRSHTMAAAKKTTAKKTPAKSTKKPAAKKAVAKKSPKKAAGKK